jgi:hypothetical protein
MTMKTMTRKEAEGILNEMMGVDLSTQAVSNDQPKRFPFPDMDAAMERIETLEAVLRAVDSALENEFGGFYLSAPEGEPMFDIREMLRGAR